MNQITDEATENVVLGSLVLNPSEYSDVAQYIPEIDVFSQKKSKSLWVKITKMIRSGVHIDTLTLCNSISSDDMSKGITRGYVVMCTSNACTLGMTQVYAQSIYEKYLLRKIISEADDIKNNVIHHGRDVYDMISSTHNLMGELIRVRPGAKFSIDDAMSDTLQTMKDGGRRMIKTGYREIDGLAGGLTRGEISIVGGRPGHGKTTFLVNLLSSLVSNGHRVALFNRELPNTEVMKKLICIEMPKLRYKDVRMGISKNNDRKFIEYLKEANEIITKKYSEEKFIMFDNIKDLIKTSSEVKKFKPDVVIDDYLQLIKPHGKYEERRLQLENICNDYKWLAKESECAVVLASQLNRSLENRSREHKQPQLSDLAESGAIEQVAENVFFVFYPWKVDPSSHEQNEIHLIASKVRYGQSKNMTLSYAGDICTMYDDWSVPNIGVPNETISIPL